jgi:fibronectin-binding autotransporter adhesin
MAKPAITKRVTKGSALTYAELDTNFQNLADATISVTAGANTAVLDLNDALTVVGAGGATVSVNAGTKTLTVSTADTVNAFQTIAVAGQSNVVADATNDTLTLVAGTGITLTTNATTDSVTIASAGTGTVNTGASAALAFYPSPGGTVVDDTLITYSQSVGLQTLTATNALTIAANGAITLSGTGTTDITGNGLVTITPGTNNSISLNTTGTGAVSIGGLGALTAASVSNGGSGVRIDGGGTIGITNATNADIYITPVGTGKLIVANDMNIGQSAAGVTVLSNWNNSNTFILLKNRNASGVGQVEIKNNNVEISAGTGSNTGDIILKTGGSNRVVAVGDGSNQANITSAIPGVGTSNLNISAGTGGAILLGAGTDSNITITPTGTGQTVIKNLEYNENVFSLGTTSGTIAPNATNGNVQTITLNGNLTINAFTSPVSGQTITLVINTNGTGRTLTSSMLFAGASKTLSTTSTVDILTMSYIGTTYYASLVKGYA